LPEHFFFKFNAAGYNIEIVRYDIESIGRGLPGEMLAGRISEWQKGESFYAHQADYLRFVLLFREGGVYTDMDSILLRPIEETNVIGVEHCDQDTLDYCIHLTQFSSTKRYYLPIGFLILDPSHPLIFGALTYFDTRYNPDLWPCGTIYLTLAYAHLVREETQQRSKTENRGLVKILPREAFYPVPWQQVKPFFKQNDASLLTEITQNSYAFHIWGGMTAGNQPEKDSLVWHILNRYTISDPDTVLGPF